MREYRKRKRAARISARVSHVERPGWQPLRPNTGFVRKGAGRFKAALELARPFPLGVLASRVCPYCYDTGYSSPRHTVQLLSKGREMRAACGW